MLDQIYACHSLITVATFGKNFKQTNTGTNFKFQSLKNNSLKVQNTFYVVSHGHYLYYPIYVIFCLRIFEGKITNITIFKVIFSIIYSDYS